MTEDNGCPMCDKPVMGRSALLSHLEFGHGVEDPEAYLAELEGPELTGRAARRAERRAAKEQARADRDRDKALEQDRAESERSELEAARVEAARVEAARAEAARVEAARVEAARAEVEARRAEVAPVDHEAGRVEAESADVDVDTIEPAAVEVGADLEADEPPEHLARSSSGPWSRSRSSVPQTHVPSGAEPVAPAEVDPDTGADARHAPEPPSAPPSSSPWRPRLEMPKAPVRRDEPVAPVEREDPVARAPQPPPAPAASRRSEPMSADALSIFYPSDASSEPDEELVEVVTDLFARRRRLVLSVGAILVGLVVVVTAWSVGGGGGSRTEPDPVIPEFRAPFVIASAVEKCTRVGEQAEYTVTVEFSGARDIVFAGEEFPGREGDGPHTFVHTAPAGVNGYLDEVVVTDPDGIDHFVEMTPPLYLPGC